MSNTPVIDYLKSQKDDGSPFATVQPELERDRWGRPKIFPLADDGTVDRSRTVAYTRATTLAGTLDDTFGLARWQRRQTALGLAQRDDLLLAVKAAEEGDRRTVDKACDDAMEAAGASQAATEGTALHRLTDIIDLGQELPTVPDHHQASLAAYIQATAHLEVLAVEQFLVCDQVQAAGTADRIVDWLDSPYGPGPFIADLKTGSIEHSTLKIAQQLAIYANGSIYDPATGERTDTGVRRDIGLIVHMPRGDNSCRLWWVDLAAGWQAVQQSVAVRQWRRRKNLTRPAGDPVG